MDTDRSLFPPIAPGDPHRWGGALLAVVGRGELPPRGRLSPAERRVADALPARRRAEWTAGRLLSKHLAGAFLAVPADDVEVLPRTDGSPRLLVGGGPVPGAHLSISHTAHQVAAALAPEPVGVDLCRTASADVVRRVADRVLSPGEQELIGADRPEALAAAWALKEAAVKAGRGGVFGADPRGVVISGLRPPVLDGARRARVWQAGDAVLALVLAPGTRPW